VATEKKTDAAEAQAKQATPDVAKAVEAIATKLLGRRKPDIGIPLADIEAAAGAPLDAAAKQAILGGLRVRKICGSFASTKAGARGLRITRTG